MSVPIVATLAGAIVLCTFVPATPAQDAIRVETNRVVVRATIFDKERYRLLWNDPTNLWRAVRDGNVQLEGDIIEGVVIRGLTAADFQVFDDGKERVVQNVTYEQAPYWVFHDN